MDQDSNVHRDEQYPLLKVETIDGGGDIKLKQQAPNVVPTGWTVTHTPKQSWLDRWPGELDSQSSKLKMITSYT